MIPDKSLVRVRALDGSIFDGVALHVPFLHLGVDYYYIVRPNSGRRGRPPKGVRMELNERYSVIGMYSRNMIIYQGSEL